MRFSRTVGYLSELSDPGELLANGFDAVSVPFARKFELNKALDELFTSDDATSFISFLITCAERD